MKLATQHQGIDRLLEPLVIESGEPAQEGQTEKTTGLHDPIRCRETPA